MARATGIESNAQNISTTLWRRLQEGGFILLSAVACFLLIALITYHEGDPGWSHTGTHKGVVNAAGRVGAWFSDLFLYLFGYIAYMIPTMIGYGGIRIFQNRYEVGEFHRLLWCLRIVGFLLAIIAGGGLASLHFSVWNEGLPMGAGGICGQMIGAELLPVVGYLGSTLLLVSLFLAGITLATGLSWFGLMDIISRATWLGFNRFRAEIPHIPKRLAHLKQQISHFKWSSLWAIFRFKKKAVTAGLPAVLSGPKGAGLRGDRKDLRKEPSILGKNHNASQNSEKSLMVAVKRNLSPTLNSNDNPNIPSVEAKMRRRVESIEGIKGGNVLPSVDLLEENDEKLNAEEGFSDAKLEALSREVEARLLEFGVQVTVVAVSPGPVITQFELELAAGLKVSKITGLSKDLARALSVPRVRVVEVIPGKSVVGLEIPNEHRELVRLREIVESNEYTESLGPLSLALGKDISGNPVVVNLAKMPHLLVAGTTGSGKSVGINVMLLSLLYKAMPDEIKLILIDPKMLELSIYDGIPHLLTPVVTDMKDAANALRWCVGEMERRYQVMAAVGVRNLTGYNRKISDAESAKQPLYDPLWRPSPLGDPNAERPLLNKLPHIVVIIDEFADMMMVVGKKVEELIARIAQKARAAGIHMILATQRPSVDVITGLIKANVPTRIAFQVSSRIDSRTILDQQGAEQLLGHGDMLYLAPGAGIPVRIHGAFVSDEEVHAVVKALKQSGEPDYAIDILGGGSAGLGAIGGWESEEDGEQDDLYDQAVQIVTESRRASISNLQRRLKIGYNRAARLIETMETAGVVSSMQSNGGREVLVGEPLDD
jgi:S-DNA-T family DNA segregation ATPase FtsK/SpoIIIE